MDEIQFFDVWIQWRNGQAETIWATQKTFSKLFDVGIPAISKHLKNIFDSGELIEDRTISKMEIVQNEGKGQ